VLSAGSPIREKSRGEMDVGRIDGEPQGFAELVTGRYADVT
jgi:hypothetical protein